MNLFVKACCSADNGATLSPAWAPGPAVRGREFGSPLHAGAVWSPNSAPVDPVLELEALPDENRAPSSSAVERELTWTPALKKEGQENNALPRPVTPVTAGAGEWGPKAWASPKRGRTGSEHDAGEPPRTLSLESPDLLSNAERVAASLERGPSLPSATPLASMDANSWLSRQGSKGRQDSLPRTPDVFAAVPHMTPGTVNVLLSPPSMTASTPTPAAAVAAPSPTPPLTVLLPRGARLLLRAARPTPVKEARLEAVPTPPLAAWQIGVALTLLLFSLMSGLAYTLLHHQPSPLAPTSTALVPYTSPKVVAADWYLVTHQMYVPTFLRLPTACSPAAPTIAAVEHHLAVYGVCHSVALPLGRVEGLHPALLPALRLDLPALASVARSGAAAVARAATPTRLPLGDVCSLAVVAAAAVYCAHSLRKWHTSSLAASAEAATPSQAACDDDDDAEWESEAEHVVASLPRQASEDTAVTPAHPRALSFSRAEEPPIIDQGEATVKGGRRRRAAAPAVQAQAQGRRTRATAGRRA